MNVVIHWSYYFKKAGTVNFSSESLPAEQALMIVVDLEKTGRLKDVYFEDDHGSRWTKKQLIKMVKEVEDEPQEVMIFFDGGYLKEERLSSIGVVIYYKQNHKRWRIRRNAQLEYLKSNNEAEYAALYEALKTIEELQVHHQSCVIKGDSLVVINQLKGEWPCFEEDLQRWMDKIEQKIAKLRIKPVYEAILRKENQEADRLATQAMNGEVINSRLELQ